MSLLGMREAEGECLRTAMGAVRPKSHNGAPHWALQHASGCAWTLLVRLAVEAVVKSQPQQAGRVTSSFIRQTWSCLHPGGKLIAKFNGSIGVYPQPCLRYIGGYYRRCTCIHVGRSSTWRHSCFWRKPWARGEPFGSESDCEHLGRPHSTIQLCKVLRQGPTIVWSVRRLSIGAHAGRRVAKYPGSWKMAATTVRDAGPARAWQTSFESEAHRWVQPNYQL